MCHYSIENDVYCTVSTGSSVPGYATIMTSVYDVIAVGIALRQANRQVGTRHNRLMNVNNGAVKQCDEPHCSRMRPHRLDR